MSTLRTLGPDRDGIANGVAARLASGLGASRRYVATADGLVHAFELGARCEGRPVVLLHGLAGDSEPLVALAATLAHRRRCLVPDAIGLAPRSRPLIGAPPLGPRGHARALDRWLDALGVGEVDVFGVSLGGWLGLWLAAISTRVRGLVLATPAGARKSPEAVAELARCLGPREMPALMRRIFAPRTADALGRLAGSFARPDAIRGFLDALAPDGADWIEAALPSVRARTFVVASETDALAGPETAQLVVDRVPTARGVWVEGAGHGLVYESPAPVYLALRRELGLEGEPHSALGYALLVGAPRPRTRPIARSAS